MSAKTMWMLQTNIQEGLKLFNLLEGNTAVILSTRLQSTDHQQIDETKIYNSILFSSIITLSTE